MKRLLPIAILFMLTCSQAFAADQPAPAPAGPASNMLTVTFGLLVVLAVMVGALWLMKRSGMGPMQRVGAIKVVGGVSVGNRERVLVLEVADQWIVVGVAPGSVNALANMPRQEQLSETATPQQASQFANWLKQKIDKRNAGNDVSKDVSK